jgi:hypothetical protein
MMKPSMTTSTFPSSSTSYSPFFFEEKVPNRRIFWEYMSEFSGEYSAVPRGALGIPAEVFQSNLIP